MTKSRIGETTTWQGNFGRYLIGRERESLRRSQSREEHEHQVAIVINRLGLVNEAGIKAEDFVSATPVSRLGRLTAGIRFDQVIPATTYHFEGKDTLFNGWVDQVRVVTGRYLGTRLISGFRVDQTETVLTTDGFVGELIGRGSGGKRQIGRDSIAITNIDHSLEVPHLSTVWGPSLVKVSDLSTQHLTEVNETLQALLEPVEASS